MSTVKMATFLRDMLRKVHVEETEDIKKILDAESFQVEVPVFITEPIQKKTFDFHAAVNDTGIRSTVTARTLETIEAEEAKKLKSVFGLSEEKYKELRGNPKERTYTEFLDILYGELKNLSTPEPGSGDPKPDPKQKEIIERLQQEKAVLSEEFEKYKQESATNQQRMLANYKLESLISSYQFRDDLKDAAPGIRKMMLNELNDAFVIKEGENGELLPYLKNEPDVRATNPTNNALRTIKEVIEEKIAPYVRKSGPDTPEKQAQKVVIDKKESVQKMYKVGTAPGLGTDI